MQKYAELGGAAGFLGNVTEPERCGLADGGCMAGFENGAIYWTAASGAHVLTGAIRARWTSEEAEAGSLAYPLTDEICGLIRGGCLQQFQGGDIVWTPRLQAIVVDGTVLDTWSSAGGPEGRLGYPVTDERCGLRGGGCVQDFEGGAVYVTPGIGTFINWGAIRSRYAATGWENGVHGLPLSAEVCGLRGGGCYQAFQYGTIVWSPASGARSSTGAIRQSWIQHAAEDGGLGYPVAEEVCGLPRGGCYQWYQGGIIWWAPGVGPHPVWGGIRTLYERSGWVWGWLGYPTSDEICQGSSCIQRFQNGTITWENGRLEYQRYNECENLNNGRSVYGNPGTSAVTLAIAEDYGQSGIWVVRCRSVAGQYIEDWAVRGYAGAAGFKPPGVPSGPTRYLYSPTGSYSITEAFGLGNPGTSLPYTTLNPRSRWGGNPWTSTYNTYFESDSWVGYDENMWYFATRPQRDYLQGAVINYNRPPDSPIVQDAGFAIFLHENPVPTAGCIAIPHDYLVDWLVGATSGDRIIMGVRWAIFR